MPPAETEPIATRSRFVLGMAVASLVCIFAFSIPLLTYLGEGLFLAHDVPLSKAIDLLIRVSPWLPGSIAVFGSLGLLLKESRMSPVAALRWNWAAVFAVAVQLRVGPPPVQPNRDASGTSSVGRDPARIRNARFDESHRQSSPMKFGRLGLVSCPFGTGKPRPTIRNV